MQKSIQLRGQEILYTLRKSVRAKRLRVTIGQGSGVVVTLPREASLFAAEEFLLKKAIWILRSIEYFKKSIPSQNTYGRYEDNKNKAYEFAVQKIEQCTFLHFFILPFQQAYFNFVQDKKTVLDKTSFAQLFADCFMIGKGLCYQIPKSDRMVMLFYMAQFMHHDVFCHALWQKYNFIVQVYVSFF